VTYEQRRESVEDRFLRMRPIPEEHRLHTSPSGQFVLAVDTYAEPDCDWNFTRGVLREVGTEEVIADIRRAASQFLFAWVAHTQGEFLVCGEDPEGYNVIDIRRGINVCTPPDGSGFNWLTIYPSPDGRVLAVEGCVWGFPNQVVFLNFADPLKSPLPEMARFAMPTDIQGWVSDTTFKFTRFKVAERDYESIAWTRAGYYST